MNSAVPVQSTRSNYFFLFMCLGVLIVSLIPVLMLAVNRGWDAQIFCSAARVASLGKNPYDLRDLGLPLSWNYQPYMLPLFSAVCRFPISFESSYPVFYSLFLVAGVALWKPKPDSVPLALALSIGCFWGFGWALFSGNITALEFLLISTAFVLFESRRWEMAGLALGILASIKLLTVVYLGLLLFVPLAGARRWRVFLVSLAALASTFLLSRLLYPDLVQPFVQQALGLVPNQHNAWMETGKMSNIPLAFFLMDALALMGVRFTSIVSTLTGVALSVVIIILIYKNVNLRGLARDDYAAFFSLGLIALTLILPRLKPYSFMMLAPALFYLVRSQGTSRQNLILVLSVILPTVFFFVQLFATMTNPMVSLVSLYSSTILLLITFAIVVHFVNHPDQFDYARTP